MLITHTTRLPKSQQMRSEFEWFFFFFVWLFSVSRHSYTLLTHSGHLVASVITQFVNKSSQVVSLSVVNTHFIVRMEKRRGERDSKHHLGEQWNRHLSNFSTTVYIIPFWSSHNMALIRINNMTIPMTQHRTSSRRNTWKSNWNIFEKQHRSKRHNTTKVNLRRRNSNERSWQLRFSTPKKLIKKKKKRYQILNNLHLV